MKNILLPTDFSENSLNAITYAMHLFKNWECTFFVLNVQKQGEFILDDLMAATTTASIHSSIAKDNKKQLHRFVTKLQEQDIAKNFTFKELFDFDSLTAAINQVIHSKNIDLIVMGSNGATGAREALFGSNTLQVIREVSCPVLIIPENYSFKTIKTVLFTTNNCKDFSKFGLTPLTEILDMHQPALRILELIDTDHEAEDHQFLLKQFFEDLDYTHYKVKDVPAPMAIKTTTQLLEIDVHAVFIESKSFIDRFLFGSTANKISYDSQIPLLVLHK